MKVTFDKVEPVVGKLTIELNKADYEANVEDAIKKFARTATMPGFRTGKVPMPIIRKRVGTSFKAEELDKVLNKTLTDYLRENKVNMLGSPLASPEQKQQDVEKDDDFEFIFDIALAPEFDIKLSAKDKLPYYRVIVEDEKVQQQVEQFCKQHGHPETVNEYQEGDILRGSLTEKSGAEDALNIEKTSLMPQYISDEAQKKLFEGAKLGDTITFNPTKAYPENDVEVAALLRIKKEEVGAHTGDFEFHIDEISRVVPAALDAELFNAIYGQGEIKTEEEFRARIKSDMEQQFAADSDYKFLLDVRSYVDGKVGELTFPEALLKRIMKDNNSDKPESYVEDNFAKSIEELKWHLEREKLVEAQNIKIDDAELHQTAIQAARFQFAQYGMSNIPDNYLEDYAHRMLENENQRMQLIERAIDTKLSMVLKNVVKLNEKQVTLDEFNALFTTDKK